MPQSCGLTHVAMSVPPGTLTEDYRARVLEFYGGLLGWREMESLRRPDRLTIAVGGASYVNLRERPDSAVSQAYEHFGVLVANGIDLRVLWDELAGCADDLELEPFAASDEGEGSFRFRYLLPFSVEVQFYASLL